ncbi:CBS and ACT domain-containing protein [Desulfovibrio sp. OttesenSCG-928-G15]|nr:CBS and ACT domain-containing protein [Desulfovibrio sp. OttesenSCG-928-G15]
MLVQEWMTKDVITITAETSMMKASRLMKDKKIRRLPVVDEEKRVIGIISDRDVKDASPSKATTLDMHELYYLLSELKVKDIMTKNPVCAKPGDSVEVVSLILMERGFGGMPVVDDDNKILGIITGDDIFHVLVAITGVKSGGMQFAFELSTTPGSLRPVLDALREYSAGIVSVLTSQDSADAPTRRVYIRIRPMEADKAATLVEHMKTGFTSLLYWEPGYKGNTE